MSSLGKRSRENEEEHGSKRNREGEEEHACVGAEISGVVGELIPDEGGYLSYMVDKLKGIMDIIEHRVELKSQDIEAMDNIRDLLSSGVEMGMEFGEELLFCGLQHAKLTSDVMDVETDLKEILEPYGFTIHFTSRNHEFVLVRT
jgi:hypothetical protein